MYITIRWKREITGTWGGNKEENRNCSSGRIMSNIMYSSHSLYRFKLLGITQYSHIKYFILLISLSVTHKKTIHNITLIIQSFRTQFLVNDWVTKWTLLERNRASYSQERKTLSIWHSVQSIHLYNRIVCYFFNLSTFSRLFYGNWYILFKDQKLSQGKINSQTNCTSWALTVDRARIRRI